MPRQILRLPEEFPSGAKYVVEGKNNARGVLRVSARYVEFPDGTRIHLPLEPIRASKSLPREALGRSRRPAAKQPPRVVRPRARAEA